METKRKAIAVAVAILLVAGTLAVVGCKKAGPSTAGAAEVELCTGCGQIKGGELCCKPDQAKCEACGLSKGSPGCCSIPKDAESAAVCTGCGQIKGSELCCKPGQTKCEGCGLTKGSPGCCKLPKEST